MATLPPLGHVPVLLAEVLDALGPVLSAERGLKLKPETAPGSVGESERFGGSRGVAERGSRRRKVVVDATVGRGGHAQALLELLGPGDLFIGLDVDAENLRFAEQRIRPNARCEIHLVHANFSQLADVLRDAGVDLRHEGVDAILADLGVSTNQLLDPRYGLSFAEDAPLDMRLDPSQGPSAWEMVNRWPERELADVLYRNADERLSRRIARRIAEERRHGPINSTRRLAELVRSVAGRSGLSQGIDPATRTFQALRMQANCELDNLRKLLETAPEALSVGGRLAVISFHSGEDRLVKHALRDRERGGPGGAGATRAVAAATDLRSFSVLTRKPMTPKDAEVAANPRARSAKLRVLQRIA